MPSLRLQSFSPIFRRRVSTEALQSSLHKKLTSRRPNTIFNYLSPTPSHLLNLSLADFLPETCYPPGFPTENLELPHLARHKASPSSVLPQGHHLVYFSPQVPSSKLLPDGTDPLQWPGEPFVRRLWAGGALLFNNDPNNRLGLDNRRAYCREHMPNVLVKGSQGDEKVFVNIERQIGYCGNTSDTAGPFCGSGAGSTIEEDRQTDADAEFSPAIVETRDIVFMREKSIAAIKEDISRPVKILKPSLIPEFSVSLTPTQSLLFRFSALTFNAHAIHLDPQYCREVEGHRDLLVHGPLTLVLMLSVLRSQLKDGEMVRRFDYRNLAPLYANEELRICVRKDRRAKGNKYDVWIEGKEGGYAVKGSAIVEE